MCSLFLPCDLLTEARCWCAATAVLSPSAVEAEPGAEGGTVAPTAESRESIAQKNPLMDGGEMASHRPQNRLRMTTDELEEDEDEDEDEHGALRKESQSTTLAGAAAGTPRKCKNRLRMTTEELEADEEAERLAELGQKSRMALGGANPLLAAGDSGSDEEDGGRPRPGAVVADLE